MTRLSVTQGDTAILAITVVDAAGDPVDLGSFPIWIFTIKRSRQDSDRVAIFQGTKADGDIDLDPDVDEDNVALVTVPKEFTALLRSGRLYFWDLEIQDGEITFTPCSGEILPEGQVTGSG